MTKQDVLYCMGLRKLNPHNTGLQLNFKSWDLWLSGMPLQRMGEQGFYF
jgi:hypothetical protein